MSHPFVHFALASVAASFIFGVQAKGEGCRVVRGHLYNRPVTDNCDSPTFCAEGELLGRLNGRSTQKGVVAAPAWAALTDPGIPPSLFLGSAAILLETSFCGGVL